MLVPLFRLTMGDAGCGVERKKDHFISMVNGTSLLYCQPLLPWLVEYLNSDWIQPPVFALFLRFSVRRVLSVRWSVIFHTLHDVCQIVF